MSLIEVMIVLAIGSIVVGLASAQIQQAIARARIMGQIDEVQAHLEQARSSARSLMSPTTVSISGSRLLVASPLAGTQSYALGDRVLSATFNTESRSVTFNTRGGLDSASPVRMTLITSLGDVVTFTLYPAIGAVRKS